MHKSANYAAFKLMRKRAVKMPDRLDEYEYEELLGLFFY